MYYPTSTHVVTYTTHDGKNFEFDLYRQHTLCKKFDLVFKPVNDMLMKDQNFEVMYDKFIELLISPEENKQEIIVMTPKIFDYAIKLADSMNYLCYSYEAPPSKKGILKLHITEPEYRYIMMASVKSRLVCAPITHYRENCSHIYFRRFLMEHVCMEMTKHKTTFKLNHIIESTVMQTSMNALDGRSRLWNVLTNSQAKDPYVVSTSERNNIFYKGLPTIEFGRDPIKWLVSMTRTSVRFLMQDKIDQINIAVSVPIECAYDAGNDLLKMFVYEEITTNRQLVKLYGKLPPAFVNELSKQYVYPVSHFLAIPFVSMVFDLPNLNAAQMSNTVLLNLFTHEFMSGAEMGWSIFKYLLSYAVPRKKQDATNRLFENKATDIDNFIRREMNYVVKNSIKLLGFDKTSTYTSKQIESVGKCLKEFFDYDYIGPECKLDINPKIFVGEYMAYLHGLSIGKYDGQIAEAKEYIRKIEDQKEPEDVDLEIKEEDI
jgi:hypothetical protein